MENNLRKKLKDTKGITLIALVITIIVLLILAGVSLSAVFSQDGIFSRAEQATDKYGQAKARETLELVLDEFQMTKYEEGLSGQTYENRLDSKIAEVGSLIPKEDENSNNQLVIVEGHIFEIDRSVPKIVDYKGPADGVIITARVTQNGDWKNPVATVTGTIKTYSGGTITNSNAIVTKGNTTITSFPTTGGNYIIENITEDTDIKITVADSIKGTVEKTINVVIKRDTIPPTVDSLDVRTEEYKIIFTATGTDNESGLKHFNYIITSTEDTTLSGIPADKRAGIFTQEQTVEITATDDYEYTITVTATDNSDNTTPNSEAKIAKVFEGITIEEAKEKINTTTYTDYIGTKVKYQPTAGGRWRIFYYDADNYFRDGAGTIYLRRDEGKSYSSIGGALGYVAPDTAIARMKLLNPQWRDSSTMCANELDLASEKKVAWLCDPNQWTDYSSPDSKYAVGAPSVEMWIRVYNKYLKKYSPESLEVSCRVENERGYALQRGSGGITYHIHGIDKNNIAAKALVGDDTMPLCSPLEEFLTSERGKCFGVVTQTKLTTSTGGGNYKVYPLVCLN